MSFEVLLSNGSPRPLRVSPEQSLPTEEFRICTLDLSHTGHLRGSEGEHKDDLLVDELAMQTRGLKVEFFGFDVPRLSPASMAKLVRLPALAEVSSISIGSPSLDDSMIAELGNLTKLKAAHLQPGLKATGKTLGQLCGLMQLTILNGVGLTPQGLAELQRLPRLEHLNCSGLSFTAAHAATLSKVKLKSLV